tara:strand:- start:14 stop:253 length:240 start_codon:yes stop_codon:yes gene_type:complete
MLNESQTDELIDALDHARDIAREKKKDASVVSVGSNNWVAMECEPHEHYDQTLVRVCFTREVGDHAYKGINGKVIFVRE